jgi:hypothetical protein
LSRNNSGGSATAGIRAVGLLLHLEKLLKGVFGIKKLPTNEFTKYVGSVKADV